MACRYAVPVSSFLSCVSNWRLVSFSAKSAPLSSLSLTAAPVRSVAGRIFFFFWFYFVQNFTWCIDIMWQRWRWQIVSNGNHNVKRASGNIVIDSEIRDTPCKPKGRSLEHTCRRSHPICPHVRRVSFTISLINAAKLLPPSLERPSECFSVGETRPKLVQHKYTDQ